MTTAVDTLQVLHVGCGRKKYNWPELAAYVDLDSSQQGEVTHLDADGRLNPDLVCKLGRDPIMIAENRADVIIAWHVLEHIGKQGQRREWFKAIQELYRVLKPGGFLYGECPYYSGIWAWSDPTHTRAISEHSFIFFSQDAYRIEGSMISPYRIGVDFQFMPMPAMPKGYLVYADPTDRRNTFIRFALQAIKPLKPWWQDGRA